MVNEFTQKTGIEVLKVSAKDGLNVHEAFAKISDKLITNSVKNEEQGGK